MKQYGFYNGKKLKDNSYEIINICIKPEYQNKGIGTAILNEILFKNSEKEIVLYCFKENPAIKLYRRLGFEKCRRNRNTLSNEETVKKNLIIKRITTNL